MTTETGALRQDNRRACALTAHVARGDGEGARAVLIEAVQAERYCELTFSLAALTLHMAPALQTPDGVAYLRQMAAQLEAGEPC